MWPESRNQISAHALPRGARHVREARVRHVQFVRLPSSPEIPGRRRSDPLCILFRSLFFVLCLPRTSTKKRKDQNPSVTTGSPFCVIVQSRMSHGVCKEHEDHSQTTTSRYQDSQSKDDDVDDENTARTTTTDECPSHHEILSQTTSNATATTTTTTATSLTSCGCVKKQAIAEYLDFLWSAANLRRDDALRKVLWKQSRNHNPSSSNGNDDHSQQSFYNASLSVGTILQFPTVAAWTCHDGSSTEDEAAHLVVEAVAQHSTLLRLVRVTPHSTANNNNKANQPPPRYAYSVHVQRVVPFTPADLRLPVECILVVGNLPQPKHKQATSRKKNHHTNKKKNEKKKKNSEPSHSEETDTLPTNPPHQTLTQEQRQQHQQEQPPTHYHHGWLPAWSSPEDNQCTIRAQILHQLQQQLKPSGTISLIQLKTRTTTTTTKLTNHGNNNNHHQTKTNRNDTRVLPFSKLPSSSVHQSLNASSSSSTTIHNNDNDDAGGCVAWIEFAHPNAVTRAMAEWGTHTWVDPPSTTTITLENDTTSRQEPPGGWKNSWPPQASYLEYSNDTPTTNINVDTSERRPRRTLTVTTLNHVRRQERYERQMQHQAYQREAQKQQTAFGRHVCDTTTPWQLPRWNRVPWTTGQPAFLYRMVLRPPRLSEMDGSSSSCRSSSVLQSIKERPITMGLLLPVDLQELCRLSSSCSSSSKEFFVQTSFFIPLSHTNQSVEWTVQLHSCGGGSRVPSGVTSCQLQWLRHFQHVLRNWKTYGHGRNQDRNHDDSDDMELDDVSLLPSLTQDGSTEFLVPLVQRQEDGSCCADRETRTHTSLSLSHEWDIDWTVLEHEMKRHTIPFLDHRRHCCPQGDRQQPPTTIPNEHKSFVNTMACTHLVLHRQMRHMIEPIVMQNDDDDNHGWTAASPFPSQFQTISSAKHDFFLRRFGLNLHTATFADYFEKRYGTL